MVKGMVFLSLADNQISARNEYISAINQQG